MRDSKSRRTRFSNCKKVISVQTALRNSVPFHSGMCVIPDHQRFLYYTHDDRHCRIDFSDADLEEDELEALYRACEPAEFDPNGENVLDEPLRKARKMDPASFSTFLDPRSLGIHEKVSKALLAHTHTTMDMELCELNVYGKGDFFEAHQDTPRSQDAFGSLVVILPTWHEGGQLVLYQDETEWTIDSADKLLEAMEACVYFVAFLGDIEHEVLPVTSGYRVALTYDLYHKPVHPSVSSIPNPFHLNLKQALADLVNDKSKLSNGGYLGFGLVHEYLHASRNLIDSLVGQLKGSDHALADVCEELGLRYSLRMLYRGICDSWVNLITTRELDIEVDPDVNTDHFGEYLEPALKSLTIEQVEGVIFDGEGYDFHPKLALEEFGPWMQALYRDPVTRVLEVTPMKSSVEARTIFLAFGNDGYLDYFHGTACMLVAVEPAKSRKLIGA